jgi:hypothetical protein
VLRKQLRAASNDGLHGLMERKPQNLNMEVNGIAREIAYWPAPVTVFEDETREGGQNEVAPSLFEQLEVCASEARAGAAPDEQRGSVRGSSVAGEH